MSSRRDMFWREFQTQKEAASAIQAIVNAQPFDVSFESALLSDLIVERHYFCSLRQLRPARFRKLRGYGAYTLQGDFEDIGWHPVSWTKCLRPELKPWDRVVRAMRDRIEPVKAAYRAQHPECEMCGSRASNEVHHLLPSFSAICESVRVRFSEADVSSCIAD